MTTPTPTPTPATAGVKARFIASLAGGGQSDWRVRDLQRGSIVASGLTRAEARALAGEANR